MPYVTTADGTAIYHLDWGGDGTPVLLSHGWPLNADAWDDQAMLVADNTAGAPPPRRAAARRRAGS